jgi:DNA recombination protein RmuC
MKTKVEVEFMGVFEYVMFGLIALVLIAVVILIILVIQKKSIKVENKVDVEMHTKIATLQAKVEELNKDITNKVQLTLAENAKNEIASDAQNAKKLGEEISNRLGELNKQVQEALLGANKAQGETLTNLGKQIQALQTANTEVTKLGETVSDLSKIIKGDNQKRGKFGEFMLENILDNVFEGNKTLYDTQYSLTIGENRIQPDGVIILPRDKGGMMFIDAKFPYAKFPAVFNEAGEINPEELKAFSGDVKKQIDQVATKYIISGRTVDYALCYFPSDEIYNFVNTKLADLASYARKKNVILVSPATLQPVLFTLKNLMIEYKRSEKLQEMNAQIAKLARDFNILNNKWNDLEKSINSTKNKADEFAITYRRLDGAFTKISNVEESETD